MLKKNMKNHEYLFFYLLVVISNIGCHKSSSNRTIASIKKSRPNWIYKIPKSASHKFYVGFSSNQRSEEKSVVNAAKDAYDQAIRENFGTEVLIKREVNESLKDVKLSGKFQEVSKKIKFINFEKQKMHVEKRASRFNTWILFKYPIKEISKEKKRLEKKVGINKQEGKLNKNIKSLKERERKLLLEKSNFLELKKDFSQYNIKEKEDKVEKFLGKLCNKKNSTGCYTFGQIEFKKGNIPLAEKLFRIACNENDMKACYMVGFITLGGKTAVQTGKYTKSTKELKKASKFLRKACDGYSQESCALLGLLAEKRNNTKEAKILFKKSCDQSNHLGCFNFDKIKYYEERTWENAKVLHDKFNELCGMQYIDRAEDDVLFAYDRPKKNEKGYEYLGCYQRELRKIVRLVKSYNEGMMKLVKAKARNKRMSCYELKGFIKACDIIKNNICSKIYPIEIKKSSDILLEACTLLAEFAFFSDKKVLIAETYLKKACNMKSNKACKGLKKIEAYKNNEASLQKDCSDNHVESCYFLGLSKKRNKEISKAREYLKKSCAENLDLACLEFYKIMRLPSSVK